MKPTPEHSAERSRSAEDAFSKYLRLLDESQEVDFDDFCREHAHIAEPLRTLRDDWQRMAGLVDDLGSSLDEDSNHSTQNLAASENHRLNPDTPRSSSELSATFEMDVEGRTRSHGPGGSVVSSVIERLSSNPGSQRYSARGEIARGGMGVIQRMWDSDLRRNLAMKVMLDRKQRKGARDSSTESRQIGRFLEEAQITGQLDHPGIVPVHELGLNDAGQLYFTMRLVRGRDLRAILELVHDELEGWTVARALGVIQRVCEAMAYAHSKRVIHRDIKPSNIMVGRFGEVYVMDWGLAKVMGRKDMHDLRPVVDGAETVSRVQTDRQDDYEQHPGSPLQTMDGTVVGTPSYMSPEQAKGQDDLIGPHSDIYSVGALLYQLLSGQMPYIDSDERVSPYTLLNAVREGPPRPIHQINKRVPPELVAICEKAMAREIGQRYPSMQVMADELRAFIEGRVVRTYETGAFAEARKWVVRNKVPATVLAIGLMVLAALLINLYNANENLQQSNEAKTKSEKAARDAKTELEGSNAQLLAAVADARKASLRADEATQTALYREYVANIAAIDASLRSDEVLGVADILEKTPAVLRGWEWQHLSLKLDPSLATLSGHKAPVEAIAFAPGGRRLASASRDGFVRIWNVATQSQEHELPHGNDSITAIAYHGNGRTLACAGAGGKISLWNADEGSSVGELLPDPETAPKLGAITSLMFSPNGKRLYAGTSGKRVCAWNVDNAEFSAFPSMHVRSVTALAVSMDGSRIVSASEDKTAAIWDAASGETIRSLFGHDESVLAVDFYPTPNAPYIATGSEDGAARLFDAQDGSLLATYDGHSGSVNSVHFSEDGSELLTGSEDGTLRRWSTFSGELLSTLVGHEKAVRSAAFSPDGVLMASGSDDHTVKLWDRAYGLGYTRLQGHTDKVRSLALSPDGLRALSSSADGRVRLWETDTLLSLTATDLPLRGAGVVAFSPDGTQIAVGLEGLGRDTSHPIYFWDASAYDVLIEWPAQATGHAERILALAYSPDGRRVASASADDTVKLWNSQTGALMQTLEGHTGAVHSLAFHPTESLLASGSYNEKVRVWNLGTGETIHEYADGEGTVGALAWSPDGQVLAASYDQVVSLRDIDAGETVLLHGHQDHIDSLSFHPDGTRLASASQDGSVRIWDRVSGSPLLTLRVGKPCRAVQFSPDGGRLYAALGSEIRVLETASPAVTFELRRGRALAAERGQQLFQDRLDRYVLPASVIDSLRDDDSVDPIVRDEAIRLARNFGTQPDRLAHTAWLTLRSRNSGETAYDDAFRLANAASTMQPGDSFLMCVLGAAHYRRGDYSSALSALENSDLLHKKGQEHPRSWILALTSLAHQQLGNTRKASEAYLEAFEVGKNDVRSETQNLIHEAAGLLTDADT